LKKQNNSIKTEKPQTHDEKFSLKKFLAQIELMRKYPKAFSELIDKKFIGPQSDQETIIKAVQKKVLLESQKKLSGIKTDPRMMQLAEELSKKQNDKILTFVEAKKYLNLQIKKHCQTYDFVSYQSSVIDTSKYKNFSDWMLQEIVKNDAA